MFKDIIWRRPFVTKRQRVRAKNCADVAMAYNLKAELGLKELEREDLTHDQQQEIRLMVIDSSIEVVKWSNKCAQHLGFRNAIDGNRWYERHGTL